MANIRRTAEIRQQLGVTQNKSERRSNDANDPQQSSIVSPHCDAAKPMRCALRTGILAGISSAAKGENEAA
jgi:hypothetical protein